MTDYHKKVRELAHEYAKQLVKEEGFSAEEATVSAAESLIDELDDVIAETDL